MSRQGHHFRNWARTHECRAARYHEPASEAEVASLIAEAVRDGETVRVVGAGHSWNDQVCTGHRLCSLRRLDRVLSVEPDRHRVTVEAGIRLKDLIDQLAARGLAMKNLGSIAEQSLAGAIATGTHGSGARFGNLSSAVVALRLATARGEILDLDGERDPERFEAARLSLGALGVVTRVTLQCEPLYRLEERSFGLPFDEAIARLPELVDGHDHVKAWWLPHTDRVQFYCADRTTSDELERPLAFVEDSALVTWLFALLLLIGRLAPRLIPSLNRAVAVAYFRERRRIERGDRILNIPMPPRHRETEWAIPRAHAGRALARLREVIDAEDLKVNFVVELRFVAADGILLSPSHGRESCHVGAYMREAESLPRYFAEFEHLMLELDGRPHWGKEFTVDGPSLRALVPGLARFDAVRRELDPRGTFANDFVKRIFS